MSQRQDERSLAIRREPLTVARYEAMMAEIVECDRVDRLKPVMDAAEALRVYAKRAGNFEAEGRARLIRLRAEHRAGELLKEAKADGRLAPGRPNENGSPGEPFLESVGITKKQSFTWRLFADISWEKIEADVRAGQMVTASRLIIKHAEKPGVREGAPLKTVRVHFKSKEDMEDFAKKIGQKVTMETTSIWHPEEEKPHASFWVHFENPEDMEDFANLVGKKITMKTRTIDLSVADLDEALLRKAQRDSPDRR